MVVMKQLISNGEMFKLAFTMRYKKQTMIDLRGISTNQLCHSTRLSRLRAQAAESGTWTYKIYSSFRRVAVCVKMGD
jgi:hypothetical protein